MNWISVRDRIPNDSRSVSIYSPTFGIAEGSWSLENNAFIQFRWNAVVKDVTHWAELPPPPGEICNICDGDGGWTDEDGIAICQKCNGSGVV